MLKFLKINVIQRNRRKKKSDKSSQEVIQLYDLEKANSKKKDCTEILKIQKFLLKNNFFSFQKNRK